MPSFDSKSYLHKSANLDSICHFSDLQRKDTEMVSQEVLAIMSSVALEEKINNVEKLLVGLHCHE